MLAARLVQIVIEVRAGRDEAVDVAIGDQVRDHQPQTAGGERARHAQEDRHVVLQHLLPDAVRGGEIASLKRDPLHASEDLIRRQPRLDGERLDRRLQETRLLLHAETIKSYLERLCRRGSRRSTRSATSAAAVVSPRGADADGERREETGDEIRRRARAPADVLIARRSNVRVHAWPASANTAACIVWRNSGQVPRPRCGRAIGQRYSSVGERDVAAGERVRREAAQQAKAPLPKSTTPSPGRIAAEQERAADRRRRRSTRRRRAGRRRRDAARSRQVGAGVGGHGGRVGERSEAAADELRGGAGGDAVLAADRVAVGARRDRLPRRAQRRAVAREACCRPSV